MNTQQQQTFRDLSLVASFNVMKGIVNNSSEDIWYNCLDFYLSYFTNFLSCILNLYQILSINYLIKFYVQHTFILSTYLILNHI